MADARAKDPRPWIRVTLDFADHPKIAALSDRAFRALVEMLLWSKSGLTDGELPAAYVHRRWGNPNITQSVTDSDTDPVSELLTNDPKNPTLKKLSNGNYYIHDYAEHQETKALVEARKARNRANGRLGGRPKKTQSVTQSVSDSVGESGTDVGTPNQNQTLDVQTSLSKDSDMHTPPAKAGRRRKPQTSFPPGWKPKPRHLKKCEELGIDLARNSYKFQANAEAKDLRYADWDRAFDTWLLNAEEWGQGNNRTFASQTSGPTMLASEVPDDW